MSKSASDLTMAIRGLCEVTKGAITHSEARIRLDEIGFKPVTDPGGRQSPELTAWLKYDVDYNDPESIQTTADECGFSDPTLKAVLKEHKVRTEFKSERNNFDVTKNIWKKNKASGKATPSRKPAAASRKNARAATAAKKNQPVRATTAAKKNQPTPARPRGKNKNRQQQKKVAAPAILQTGAELEALAFVESNGGMAAVEKSLTAARSTVSELEQVIDSVAALTKRISAAA